VIPVAGLLLAEGDSGVTVARETTIRELNEHYEIMRSLVEASDTDLSQAERSTLAKELDQLLQTLRRLKLTTSQHSITSH